MNGGSARGPRRRSRRGEIVRYHMRRDEGWGFGGVMREEGDAG